MTNGDIWKEMQKLSKRMKELLRKGDHEGRNKLHKRYRELLLKYDFGYEVGDKVYCPIAHKTRVFTITKVYPDARYELDHEVIVGATLIKRYEVEPEQTTIFDFL